MHENDLVLTKKFLLFICEYFALYSLVCRNFKQSFSISLCKTYPPCYSFVANNQKFQKSKVLEQCGKLDIVLR